MAEQGREHGSAPQTDHGAVAPQIVQGAAEHGAAVHKHRASRRLPDGAKEILQDFVVAVLRNKVDHDHFVRFAAEWFQKLFVEDEKKRTNPSASDPPKKSLPEDSGHRAGEAKANHPADQQQQPPQNQPHPNNQETPHAETAKQSLPRDSAQKKSEAKADHPAGHPETTQQDPAKQSIPRDSGQKKSQAKADHPPDHQEQPHQEAPKQSLPRDSGQKKSEAKTDHPANHQEATQQYVTAHQEDQQRARPAEEAPAAHDATRHDQPHQANPDAPHRPPSVSQQKPPSISQEKQPSISQQKQPSMDQQKLPSISQQKQPSIAIDQQKQPSMSVDQQKAASISQQKQPSIAVDQQKQPSISVDHQKAPSISQQKQPSIVQQKQDSINNNNQKPPSISNEAAPPVDPPHQGPAGQDHQASADHVKPASMSQAKPASISQQKQPSMDQQKLPSISQQKAPSISQQPPSADPHAQKAPSISQQKASSIAVDKEQHGPPPQADPSHIFPSNAPHTNQHTLEHHRQEGQSAYSQEQPVNPEEQPSHTEEVQPAPQQEETQPDEGHQPTEEHTHDQEPNAYQGAHGQVQQPQATPQSTDDKKLSQSSVNRRQGVSAESYDPAAAAEDPVEVKSFPKSDEQLARVKTAVHEVLIFKSLDEEHLHKVIDALEEKLVEPGDDIIKYGDDNAEYFYVIEEGDFDVFVQQNGQMVKIHEYNNSGSFGELALMYHQPRAATVTARTAGRLWQLDRDTFKRIVVRGAHQKRELYMSLMDKVDFLADLKSYQKQNICDALIPRPYRAGDIVIHQGEEGDGMYFVEAGTVVCTRLEAGDPPENAKEVLRVGPGGYVGELALIANQARAATVTAAEDSKLAFLDRLSFERLLGPCKEILEKNIEKYRDRLSSVFSVKEAATP